MKKRHNRTDKERSVIMKKYFYPNCLGHSDVAGAGGGVCLDLEYRP